jgi:hypothetical protein
VSRDFEASGAGVCQLCGRSVRKLSRHHLIPRTRHKNKRNKRTFSRQEVHRTVDLCVPCHKQIHATVDNKELERRYNTLEALAAHPEIRKFVGWIGNKPHGGAASAR